MGAANHVENRWSKRRQLSIDVDVVREGAMLAHSHTRDVGLGGVFIEMAGTQPSLDTDVDLLFSVQGSDDSVTRHRMRAKVTRLADDGVGFMFMDFDTQAFRSLQAIMRQAPDQPGA